MRAATRIAAILLLLIAMAPFHLIIRKIGRSPFPRWFLSGAAWLCGARAQTTGVQLAPRGLILANHTSWLDILVLGSATDTRFVSKAEVAEHRLLRWLADQNETLYVERAERSQVAKQARSIAAALDEARPLALFPEGTTGNGLTLLPFRPALLSALADAPAAVEIRPVAIDYGAMRGALGWADGESGKDNALRLLGRRGSFPVVIRLLPALDRASDRKTIARQAQAAITRALGEAR